MSASANQIDDIPDNESVISRSSRASTKPSGIRVPTVSRLCSHSTRKPSIPTTPDAKSELILKYEQHFIEKNGIDDDVVDYGDFIVVSCMIVVYILHVVE